MWPFRTVNRGYDWAAGVLLRRDQTPEELRAQAYPYGTPFDQGVRDAVTDFEARHATGLIDEFESASLAFSALLDARREATPFNAKRIDAALREAAGALNGTANALLNLFGEG